MYVELSGRRKNKMKKEEYQEKNEEGNKRIFGYVLRTIVIIILFSSNIIVATFSSYLAVMSRTKNAIKGNYRVLAD